MFQTHPKVRGSKAIRSRDIVCCLGGVCVVGIDVSQQGAHHCRNAWAHVLRRQACEVTAKEIQICKKTQDSWMMDGYVWKLWMHRIHTQILFFKITLFWCKRHTSWPGRWTPHHNAWQTHRQSPGGSPQNKPSTHHPLWHQGSSPHRCSEYLSHSGRGSTEENVKALERPLKKKHREKHWREWQEKQKRSRERQKGKIIKSNWGMAFSSYICVLWTGGVTRTRGLRECDYGHFSAFTLKWMFCNSVIMVLSIHTSLSWD